MPLILSIETATTVCSVALYRGDTLLGTQTLFIDKSHSGLLAPSMASLVQYCSHKFSDLDAVAVSKGPGSYTGLRIGVSAAKGLCFALGIPLIAINTLKAMAQGVSKYNKGEAMLCPMIDARRMEVYCLVANHDMNIIDETKPVIVEEDFLQELLQEREVLFFGNGSDKCRGVIKHSNAIFIPGIHPDAANIGFLAHQKFARQQFEDVAYFEPFYLKEFRMSKPKNQ
ncbi:MAG: tRNA (adenosine(37)-N6)-threonylcarbamoyltransferase complex dimerization subunit type 1 TsaB [Fulvivirga sp.]